MPSTPPGSDPNPATCQKALHQYARGRKTHATTLHAPPTPGPCPHGAITQRVSRACSTLRAMVPLYPTQYQLPQTHATECVPMLRCDTTAPNPPCHVPIPDGVSECGLSKLPSSIHSDDETEHDAFFVQTCVVEVENAEYIAPQKPLLSMRVEDRLDEELDPRSRLREYVDSKRKLVAKKLCYAKPTRSSWPMKEGR